MIWLDAQLPPRLARWIQDSLDRPAVAVRDLGLRDADDVEIFDRARAANAIVLTKDRDFAEMITRRGAPPAVIWLAVRKHLGGSVAGDSVGPYGRSAGIPRLGRGTCGDSLS